MDGYFSQRLEGRALPSEDEEVSRMIYVLRSHL
jgi:hypothetical protein